MKQAIQQIITDFFHNANPKLDSLSIRIECPFATGLSAICEGVYQNKTIYFEIPFMDELLNFVDDLRNDNPSEQFNIVNIQINDTNNFYIKKEFDSNFQHEVETMIKG